jgi:hypothetical protein
MTVMKVTASVDITVHSLGIRVLTLVEKTLYRLFLCTFCQAVF